MTAALAIASTLLGVVVGAALAFLRDRAQWSHEDAIRWHDAKFTGYAAFLTAAREAERSGVIVAMSTMRAVRLGPSHEPQEFERQGWETWQSAQEILRKEQGVLELVGSSDVVAAANALEKALHVRVEALTSEMASVPRVPGDELTMGEIFERGLDFPELPDPEPQAKMASESAAVRLREAFDGFVGAARSDLGASPHGKLR